MLSPWTAVLSLLIAAPQLGAPHHYEVGRFTEHQKTICSVNVTPTGRVITSARDENVFSWNLSDCQIQGGRKFEEAFQIRSTVSPDGNVVASCDETEEVLIWLRGQPSKKIGLTSIQEYVVAVAFSPDGALLATGDDASIITWDATKIYRDGALHLPAERRALDVAGEVETIQFSPDSRLIAAISAGDGIVLELWNAASGQKLFSQKVDGLALAFAPDGKSVLAGETIFDTATLKPITTLKSFYPLHAAAFAPNGAYVATAGEDNRLIFWHPRTGERLAVVRAHDDAVKCLAFTPQGDRLITGSEDGTARIWDAPRILTERPIQEPMSKVAAQPHAYEIWRLGFCYSRTIMGMTAGEPMPSGYNEAKSRAEKLGIELPALPTEEQLKSRGNAIESGVTTMKAQIDQRFGKTQASLFQLACSLPMLRAVYDPTNESMKPFGKQTLSKIGIEMEREFGAVPTMFETFHAQVLEGTSKKAMEKAFDGLIREITLALKAQHEMRAAVEVPVSP